MRLLLASSAVTVTIVTVTAMASARVEATPPVPRPLGMFVRSPVYATARGKMFTVSTPTGHVHVTVLPPTVGPEDRTDPWTGREMFSERKRAILDWTSPWTGDPIAARSSSLSADPSDPWH